MTSAPLVASTKQMDVGHDRRREHGAIRLELMPLAAEWRRTLRDRQHPDDGREQAGDEAS